MTRRSDSALPSIGSLECATGGQRRLLDANEVAPFEGAIRDQGDALHDEPTPACLSMLSVLPFADPAHESRLAHGQLGRTCSRSGRSPRHRIISVYATSQGAAEHASGDGHARLMPTIVLAARTF